MKKLGWLLCYVVILFIEFYLIMYGWNNILANIFNVSMLSYRQAVALDLLYGVFVPKPKSDKEFDTLECFVYYISMVVVQFVLLFIGAHII